MTGLYNMDPSVTADLQASTYIQPGIVENIELVKVVYQTTETSEFLAFYFEDDQNDKLSHTEWPMKFKRPLDQMSSEEQEKALGLIKRQKRLIAQIVEAILGKGAADSIKANNFQEYAEAVVKLLTGKFEGIKLRAKVVYDYRGFTSLANNPRYRFIEPMTITKEKSAIRILANDRLTRPNQRNEERAVNNPLEFTLPTNSEADPF